MPYCQKWYDACQLDTFCPVADEDQESISSLDFCLDPTSEESGRLNELTHAENFCWRMGYPVYREPFCYNGVPTASRIRAGSNREEGWQPGGSGKSNTSVIAMTLVEAIVAFASQTRAIGFYFFYMSLIIMAIYAVYIFNVWQI